MRASRSSSRVTGSWGVSDRVRRMLVLSSPPVSPLHVDAPVRFVAPPSGTCAARRPSASSSPTPTSHSCPSRTALTTWALFVGDIDDRPSGRPQRQLQSRRHRSHRRRGPVGLLAQRCALCRAPVRCTRWTAMPPVCGSRRTTAPSP